MKKGRLEDRKLTMQVIRFSFNAPNGAETILNSLLFLIYI